MNKHKVENLAKKPVEYSRFFGGSPTLFDKPGHASEFFAVFEAILCTVRFVQPGKPGLTEPPEIPATLSASLTEVPTAFDFYNL
ncbi:MAG: hypothetical protein ABUK01_11795 [Leptospirales bacterium]